MSIEDLLDTYNNYITPKNFTLDDEFELCIKLLNDDNDDADADYTALKNEINAFNGVIPDFNDSTELSNLIESLPDSQQKYRLKILCYLFKNFG